MYVNHVPIHLQANRLVSVEVNLIAKAERKQFRKIAWFEQSLCRTKILYCNRVIKQVSSIHVYNYVEHRDA